MTLPEKENRKCREEKVIQETIKKNIGFQLNGSTFVIVHIIWNKDKTLKVWAGGGEKSVNKLSGIKMASVFSKAVLEARRQGISEYSEQKVYFQ